MADVRKNTEESRFDILVEGEQAGYQTYEVRDGGIVALTHTVVDPKFEGRGLAGELTRAALDDIRSQGYRVEPVCSYVEGWLGKHPEYADLVATSRTSGDLADAEEDAEDIVGVDVQDDRRI